MAKAVQVHLVSAPLQAAQALAEAPVVEQRREAMEVGNNEQRRARASRLAHLECGLDLVAPHRRNVVNGYVHSHGRGKALSTLAEGRRTPRERARSGLGQSERER